MHLLRLLPLLFTFLLLTLAAQAQEDDKAMSWIASGTTKTNYSIENLDLSYENKATRQFYSTRLSQLAFAGNLDQRSFTASTVGRLDIAEAKSGEVRLVKDQKAELNLRINVNLDSASFEIPSSTIYIADLPFNFSGKYDTLNYEFNVNGQNLMIDQVANKLAFKETEDVKRLGGHGITKLDINIKGK